MLKPTEMSFTPERLAQLRNLAQARAIPLNETLALIDEFEQMQRGLASFYDFIYVVAGSNSQFKVQAQTVLDTYLYGTNDTKVIEAAKRLAKRTETLKAAGSKYGTRKF